MWKFIEALLVKEGPWGLPAAVMAVGVIIAILVLTYVGAREVAHLLASLH